MTSVLGSLFGATRAEYAAVAPHSPEADATFVHTISYDCGGLGSGAQEQWDSSRHQRGQPSRSSYSNRDFCLDGTPTAQGKASTATALSWNEAALVVGQWTSSTASTMASTILSTTRHFSTQLGNTAPCNASSTGRTNQRSLQSGTQRGMEKAYGRGIDRDYLKGSPYHANNVQRSVIGTIGDLAARFTAPKPQDEKPKWL